MQRIDVYWRDIPAQVLVKKGRERGKYLLPQRFHDAIDRAAMRAGKGGSDAYLEEWRRVHVDVTDDEHSAQATAERCGLALQDQYTDDQLVELVANKGFSPTPND